MRRFFPSAFFAALLAGLCLSACGGGGGPDFSSQRNTLPAYPGATVARQGGGPYGETSSSYRYDRLYVTGVNVSQDLILTSMTTRLQQAGWQQETPVTSHVKALLNYCQTAPAVIKCASFVKGGVRVLVTVLPPLGFGGRVPPTYYHTHLEKQ